MAFSLPQNFGHDTNRLIDLFREYETSASETNREKALREALLIACELLGSINIYELKRRIDDIHREVQQYEITATAPLTWSEAMFDDSGHFEQFLERIESGILEAYCISQENRNRLISELSKLRTIAKLEAGKLSGDAIIKSIQTVREEVCELKDQQLSSGKRKQAYTQLVRVILIGVIVFDATANFVFPNASPAAVAASIALGATGTFLPDQK